jgi:signal peptidase I
MSRIKGGIIEVGKVILTVLVTVIIIRLFVFQVFEVEGSSMEPNFHNNEYLLVEKVSYRLHAPKRGDVVVFKYPNNPEVNYIKRIIGLPGETVRIANNQVSVNGQPLAEGYLTSGEETLVSAAGDRPYELTLSSDQYFMMGDNREHSSDSRDWGPLKRDLMIGRASVVIFPHSGVSAVASPRY